jgi:hypothetical protein
VDALVCEATVVAREAVRDDAPLYKHSHEIEVTVAIVFVGIEAYWEAVRRGPPK